MSYPVETDAFGNLSESRKFWVLHLDFDGMTYQQVVEDCEKLRKLHPELGHYKIEQSKTPNHFHVKFPKSEFPTFEEALAVAKESKADKDWLELCEYYKVFAVVTEAGKTMAKALRLKAFPPRPKKKPAYDLKQPVMLVLHPQTPMDAGRLRAICESMVDDEEWEYRLEASLHDLGQRIRIGCRDEFQAKRRARWLEQQGLKFGWEIVKVEKEL